MPNPVKTVLAGSVGPAILLGVLAPLSLYLGFIHYGGMQAVLLIKKVEYCLLLLAFTLLAYNGWQWAKSEGAQVSRESFRTVLAPLLFVLAVSVLLLGMQRSEFKIVMDEPILAATALQMHEEKESMTVGRGYEVNGSFILLAGYVDKRPSFYPFLVSLLHDLTGYRASQGLILNALLTPVFLGLLFLAGHLLWRGRLGGYLAVALFATVPLLAMNLNGAGFEMLNLVMLLATGLAAYGYLCKPSAYGLNVLVLLGVLLAQTRYESVLYVFSVAGVIAFVWLRAQRVTLTWTSAIAPILLLCVPLRRAVLEVHPALWQLEDRNVARPFALSWIPENLANAGNFFFAVNRDQPNSLLLTLSFILAMLIFVALILRKRFRLQAVTFAMVVLIAFGAIVLANFFLLMAYHWGQLDDIMATRIALPFILFQVICVVAVAGQLKRKETGGLCLLGACAIFFVSVTRPLAASSDFLDRAVGQQQVDWFANIVDEQKGERALYLSNWLIAAVVDRQSSIPIKQALNAKPKLDLHLRLKTFDAIYITWFIPSQKEEEQFQVEAREAPLIEENFEFEVLRERRLAPWGTLRMARLTGVRVEPENRAEFEAKFPDLFQKGDEIRDFMRTLP